MGVTCLTWDTRAPVAIRRCAGLSTPPSRSGPGRSLAGTGRLGRSLADKRPREREKVLRLDLLDFEHGSLLVRVVPDLSAI